MKSFVSCWLGIGFALVIPAIASAGNVSKTYKMEQPVLESDYPFEKGVHEVQFGGGVFFSLTPGTDIRPDTDFALGSVRYGWMLSTPGEAGLFRGNCEFLVDLYGGGVFDGPSGGFGGFTLILRQNFVQPDACLVPYFQIGAGGMLNSIYENHPQHLIGTAFEFNLEASIGLRYLFSKHCGIYIEGAYRHISNAGLGDRNCGLNAIGGMLGVSYFF